MNKRKGKLNKETEKTLLELGVDFRSPKEKQDDQWMDTFSQVKKSKEKNGHLIAPARSSLSYWILRQRKLFKEGRLRRSRFQLLESIGFEWKSQYKGGRTFWKR